jgi:hypothetical protein
VAVQTGHGSGRKAGSRGGSHRSDVPVALEFPFVIACKSAALAVSFSIV